MSLYNANHWSSRSSKQSLWHTARNCQWFDSHIIADIDGKRSCCDSDSDSDVFDLIGVVDVDVDVVSYRWWCCVWRLLLVILRYYYCPHCTAHNPPVHCVFFIFCFFYLDPDLCFFLSRPPLLPLPYTPPATTLAIINYIGGL